MGNTFSYHDNTIQFQLEDPSTGKISSGTFTVTSLSISSGQDPDTSNKPGDVHNLGNQGNGQMVFHFNVGRSQTTDVATFWNNNISATQSTFGHSAGVLNFAFLGTLVLTYTNSSGRTSTRTYLNVGLAQGQSAGANNWWFGGTNCTNKGYNTVACNGTDQNGAPVTDQFIRGGAEADDLVSVRYSGSF